MTAFKFKGRRVIFRQLTKQVIKQSDGRVNNISFFGQNNVDVYGRLAPMKKISAEGKRVLITEERGTYLVDKMEELGLAMEKMKLAEYVELLNRPLRLLYINFIAGLARGVGMAVGFAILGALIIYILRKLAILNLPVIGDFIAQLVRIVQVQLNYQ